MHFVEVAVQNVRGFAPSGRVALKPGYLVFKPAAPGEPGPLAGLALAILYADGRGGESSFLAPGQRSGKAAFSLVGKDGAVYRVLRELGGSGSLHRINPATQAQELITEDASEALQFLRGQAGLIPRTTFEQVCCLQLSQLPSRRPRSKPAGRTESKTGLQALSSAALPSAQSVAPAADIPAAEARLRELEKELALAREVDQLQFQLDGINSQIFELDTKMTSTEGIKRQIQQAEAEVAQAPTPEALGMPADIFERLARHPKAVLKKDEALARLQAEREAEAERVAAISQVEPLYRNPFFLGAAGVGVLFLLLGLVLRVSNPESLGRYLALLDIPAFGVAAYFALRYVDELKQSQNVGRKDEKLAARERKILEEFEAEDMPVRLAMKAADVDSPEDIYRVLGRRAELEERLQALREQLAAMEADPEFRAAAQRQAQLRREAEQLSAEVAEKGSYARDMREVEREMGRVRESIELAKAPPPAAPAAAGPAAASPKPGEPLEDPTPALLNQAADLFTTDLRSLTPILRDRFLQYLTALTDKRYTGVEWDKEGKAVLATPDGRRLPAGELPPKDLDLYYLGLRMTVVEKVSARVKLPLLIEDVLAGMEESRLPLLGRMLKHLGTVNQVLHVTAHPGFAQLSDGALTL